MKKDISVIIAAYNEEKNIRAAIENIQEILQKSHLEYELLAFDDGSRDQTGPIMDEMARTVPLKVIHNPRNCGLAYVSREGIKRAAKNYVTWFPGDNSVDKESMQVLLSALGEADIITAYMSNIHVRPLLRRWMTRIFTFSMNKIFNLNLRYYTGPVIYPVELARQTPTIAEGYHFFSEMLIRCLKKGASCKEMSFIHNPDNERNTKAFSWRNFISLIKTTAVLINDINLKKENSQVLRSNLGPIK